MKGRKGFAFVAATLCGAALARPVSVLAPDRTSRPIDVSRVEAPSDHYLDLGAAQSVAETSGYRASAWPWQTEARRVDPAQANDAGRYVDLGALSFGVEARD